MYVLVFFILQDVRTIEYIPKHYMVTSKFLPGIQLTVFDKVILKCKA